MEVIPGLLGETKGGKLSATGPVSQPLPLSSYPWSGLDD
jgi:hypothetical protein